MTDADKLLETFTSRFVWDETALDYCEEDAEGGPVIQAFATPAEALEQIYAEMPAQFPALFERLILDYRWQRADVGPYCLLANPPGPDLKGLVQEIKRDPHLSSVCLASGFIQFAKGPDGRYDPICFDTIKSSDPAQFRVVVLDHEEILCKDRIRITSVLADNFEALVRSLI